MSIDGANYQIDFHSKNCNCVSQKQSKKHDFLSTFFAVVDN